VIYRCFFNRRQRQFIDCDHVFSSIKDSLAEAGIKFTEVENQTLYFPVKHTQVEDLKKRGIFVVMYEQNYCIATQQLVLDVHSTEKTPEEIDELTQHQMTSIMIYQRINFERDL